MMDIHFWNESTPEAAVKPGTSYDDYLKKFIEDVSLAYDLNKYCEERRAMRELYYNRCMFEVQTMLWDAFQREIASRSDAANSRSEGGNDAQS